MPVNVPKKHMTNAERQRHLLSRVCRHTTGDKKKASGATRRENEKKMLLAAMSPETRKRVMNHAAVKRATAAAHEELARELDRFMTHMARVVVHLKHGTDAKMVTESDVRYACRFLFPQHSV